MTTSNKDSLSLNKFISNTGICSRREAEKWIKEGRVSINGNVAKNGNRVVSGDKVIFDGKAIGKEPKPIYIGYHKPPGVTSTTDRRDKSNIIDAVGHKQRIFPIGRLDKASTGLIILTNNGDIVNAVLREENEHEKEYVVTVDRMLKNGFIKKMENGVPILGTVTKPAKVIPTGKQAFKIILTQGLNRQIRRMCEHLGYNVKTLKRIRFMHIDLADLKVGKWRNLSKEEVDGLLAAQRK